MGAEIKCVGHYQRQKSSGTALLETDFLLFRGDFRVKIPFADISGLEADDAVLAVRTSGGVLKLELGKAALRWKDKIENPPSLLKKLGVKPSTAVAVVNVRDADFLRSVKKQIAEERAEVVFAGVESREELGEVFSLKKRLPADAALWVVYPKGQKHITENDVLQAGRAAGLVDIKVAAFSKTHTALKFVVPAARRQAT